MDNYINVDMNEIPYRFDIELRGEVFGMEIKWNDEGSFFTLALYKDDAFIADEKLVYGKKVYAEIEDETFPKVDIIPNDESGLESEITFDNFNKTVFLEVIE